MIQCKFINIIKIFTEELMAKVRKHQFVAKGDKVLWLKNSPRILQKWFHSGTSVTRGTAPPPRHTHTHTHTHTHFPLGIPLQFLRFSHINRQSMQETVICILGVLSIYYMTHLTGCGWLLREIPKSVEVYSRMILLPGYLSTSSIY